MILNAVGRGLVILGAVLFLVPAITRYPQPQITLTVVTIFVSQLDSAARIFLFSFPDVSRK